MWEAVLRGLLNVPKVARLVGQLAGQGSTAPDTVTYGHLCANVFYDVMREFLYPEGEGVFPYFAFRRRHNRPMKRATKARQNYQRFGGGTNYGNRQPAAGC